jgi:integrase
MAEANFFLKEPKSDSETLVYLFFSYDGNRLKYSTGEKIHPDFWITKDRKQRASSKMPLNQAPEFNSRLDTIEGAIKSIYRRVKNDGIIPTNSVLKLELDKELKQQKTGKISLLQFISNFIETSKGIKAPSTIKSYNNTKNHLTEYCQAKRRTIDFEDVNIDFYNSFISYMTNDLKFADNTVGNQIKNLKLFMNEATERGLNTNLDFRKKKFKKINENTDKIYLSVEELKIIYEKDLSEEAKLERVRDLFIIGCYTGLRFSDFIQLKKENIIDENKIKIRTQKTGETVVIPLHPYVKAIFEKYSGKLPDPISNQKMNDYLKIIGEKAEIKDRVEIGITKAGTLQKTIFNKHELITTHVARRSFASNLYLANVPSITIMKITGHRTEKSFLRYIRITQEENANKLLNHPFFN